MICHHLCMTRHEVLTPTPEQLTTITDLLAADERNLTWLARRTGRSVSHLFRVMKGERPISVELATDIAAALNVSPDLFLATPAEPRSTVSAAGRASQSPSPTKSVARPTESSHLEDDVWDVK